MTQPLAAPRADDGVHGPPLIEVRGLMKYYRMGESVVRALDGVDLTIRQGEFVAITGASGSGKSTMMHLLGCLDRPTRGTYELDGRNVGLLSDRELADIRNRKIGFVFQTFNLINRTAAWENVSIPLFYARKRGLKDPAMRALERVGLSMRAAHQPGELSGGERQRVAIARAIVNDPLLIMADEPTGNLDSRTGEQIMQIFHGLNAQGVTIVMVTHEPDIAAQAQRVILMRDGKIVDDRRNDPLVQAKARAAATSVPEAAPQAASRPAELPRGTERAAGAISGFICGLIAAIGMAGAAALLVATQIAGREVFKQLAAGTTKTVPLPLVIGGLGGTLLGLASVIMAIIAVVFSSGARRRLHHDPYTYGVGAGRALTGLILGWSVIGLVAVSIGMSLLHRLTG